MDKQTLSQFSWTVIAILILAVFIVFGPNIARFLGNEILDVFPQLFLDEENESELQDDCVEFKSFFPFTLKVPEKGWDGTMQYYNGEEWVTWDGNEIQPLKSGYWYYICVRGIGNKVVTKPYDESTWTYYPWVLDGTDIYCSGNIETLLDYEKVQKGEPIDMADCCYEGLFAGCNDLKTAPRLPATTLKYRCYDSMFLNCSSLESAPKLPAKTLVNECYARMFKGCKNLKIAPELPSEKMVDNCYSYMFDGCRRLKKAPALNADTLAVGCYMYMFQDCTRLKAAPTLDVTDLKESCYQGMFEGCTSLTDVQDSLPATTLEIRCYAYMFKECESLKKTPDLPAETIADYCYDSMFWGCKKLTDVPDVLPAKTLKEVCYYGMFAECASLKEVPELPADRMAGSCYQRMFLNCKKIETAPELPATYLYLKADDDSLELGGFNGRFCYANMFEGCTNLKTAPTLPGETDPRLPAMWLSHGCYYSMFKGCTSLEVAPTLPATNISGLCYYSMFEGCTSLTTVPKELPGGTNGGWVNTESYKYMFKDCTSLEKAPALPAKTLYSISKTEDEYNGTWIGNNCYANMFEGCTNLVALPELTATTLSPGCYTEMFKGCTKVKVSEGQNSDYTKLYIKPIAFESEYLSGMFDGINKDSPFKGTPVVGKSYYLHGDLSIVKVPKDYVQFTSTAPFTIGLKSTQGWNYQMWYNDDSKAWKIWDVSKTPTIAATNQDEEGNYYIYVRGVNNTIVSGKGKGWTLTGDADIECSGNIETLLDYTKVQEGISPEMAEGCYWDMFYDCTSLVKAPDLPADALTPYCYRGMFYGCKNLEDIPTILPAKELAVGCYLDMFYGCESLVVAPAIEATELKANCCQRMFRDCKSLESVPAMSVAEAAEQSCMDMFLNCEKLETAASIKLIDDTLEKECYRSMFYGCTSLETAPKLEATTMANYCYQHMFYGCTSLTEAPSLPATNLALGCYYGMFKGSGLTEAPEMKATTLATGCYREMFMGCTALATAPKLDATVLADSCYMNMFNGCRTLTDIPSILPATELTPRCYENMFQNCTSLTKAPQLPAGKDGVGYLDWSCYYGMFRGCTSLTKAPDLPAEYVAEACYAYMFYGCTNLKEIPKILPAINLTIDPTNTNGEIRKDPTHVYTDDKGQPIHYNGGSCYRAMFSGCAALETVPKLPATVLSDACYMSMFYGCKELKQVPYLPATELKPHCYNYMFCEAIMNIYESETNGFTTEYFVPVYEEDVKTLTDNEKWPVSQMFGAPNHPGFIDMVTMISREKPFYLPESITIVGKDFLEFIADSDFSITADPVWINNGEKIEYNNGDGWKEWDGTTIYSNPTYHYIHMRGENVRAVVRAPKESKDDKGNTICTYYSWEIVGLDGKDGVDVNLRCNGNIEYLLNYEEVMAEGHPTMNMHCYAGMFKGCTILTKAPELPATQLSTGCYWSMFEGCTSLVNAPELPATDLIARCYREMFMNCTSLVKAPELPAMTAAHECYNYMFAGCTSLVNAPELPATKLAMSCYSNMFNGCMSLETATALPALELEGWCYFYMFNGCTNLKEIPYLPATKLETQCYNFMFYGIKVSTTPTTTATGNYTKEYSIPVSAEDLAGLTHPISQLFVDTDGKFFNVQEAFEKHPFFYLDESIEILGAPEN